MKVSSVQIGTMIQCASGWCGTMGKSKKKKQIYNDRVKKQIKAVSTLDMDSNWFLFSNRIANLQMFE